MAILDGIMISLFLGVGIYCSLTDIRNNRVPNAIIGPALICAAICQAFGFFAFEKNGFIMWGLNLLISLVIAFLLYLGGIWGAGDVKLYSFAYLCMPYRFLSGDSFSYSVFPYMFVFVVAMVFIFIETCVLLIKKEERFSYGKFTVNTVVNYLKISIEVMALQMLLYYVAPTFVSNNGLLVSILIMGFAYFCSKAKAMQNWIIFIAFVVLLAVCILLTGGISFQDISVKTCILVLVVLLIQKFVSQYSYKRINTEDVRPGMILAMPTVLGFLQSRIHDLPMSTTEDMNSRISTEQAEAVQRWGKSSKGEQSIIIVRKIPFVPSIVIGFICFLLMNFLR